MLFLKTGMLLMKMKGVGIVAAKVTGGIFGAGAVIGALSGHKVIEYAHQIFHF